MAIHAELLEWKRNSWWFVVDKRDGKRPVGKLIHKWEDNIKMDLKHVK